MRMTICISTRTCRVIEIKGEQVSRKRKNRFKFTIKMKKNLTIVFFVIILVLAALVGRIIFINVNEGETYAKTVLEQQQTDTTTIAYKRGTILDRNGTTLAVSEDVYNVVLDCYMVNSNSKYYEPTVEALTKCITDIKKEDIDNALAESPNSRYFILKKKVVYNTVKELQDMLEDSKKYPKLDGIWLEKDYVRNYPFSTLASSVLSFSVSGNEGQGGLEGEYNDILNGTDGKIYSYINSDNEIEKTLKPATDGNTIVSTIDANIQEIVEQKIDDFNEAHANTAREGAGSNNTAVIVMDPDNGEILGMADYPEFDLNNPRDLTAYYSQEQINAMNEDEQLEALNTIWNNYCILQTYEPGSTVKLFTVAAALEMGVIRGDETFICDGVENINGTEVHCVNTSGHGAETVEESINNSCNDVMMQIGAKLKAEAFTKYQNIFGFGLKTQIDLPGEASTSQLIHTLDDMKPIDLATNSFGQNFNTTMIQTAAAFCSIINGGYYYQPHMVKKILDSSGNTVETILPVLTKQTITPETSDKIKQYCYSTVDVGTAKAAKVLGYSMGGKTGTAEKIPRKQGNYLVSFIGYAPADDPEVLVYVVIDEPNDANESQATFASELAKEIFTDIFPYMNIYPDEDSDEDKDKNSKKKNMEEVVENPTDSLLE